MSTVTENSEPVNVVDPQSNNDLVNVEQEQKHEPVNVEPKQIPEPILAQLEPEHELDNEEAEPQKQPDNVEQEPEKDTVIMEPEPNNDPVNVEPKPQSDTVNMEPEKDNVNMEPEPKNDPVNVELKPQSDTTIMEPEKDTVNMEPEPKNDPVNVELKPQSDTAIMEPEKDTINMEPEPKNDPVNVEPNRQSDTVNVELEDQNESVVVKSEHQNNPDKIESGTHNEPVNLEAVPESEPLDMELDAQTEPVVNVEPDTKNELVNFEPEPEPAKELVNAEPESDDPPVNTEPDPDDHQDQLVDTETQPIDELTETRPNNELIGADTQPNDELVSADTQPVDELVGAETQQNNEVFNAEMQPNNALIYEEMQLKSEDADHEKQPKNELVVAETQSNNNMIVEETHLNNSMIVEEIHPDNQLVHAETHNPSNMFVHAETHHPNHHELVNAENLQRYNELVNADMQHYEFVDAATSHPNNQLVSMETQPYTNTPNIQISPNNELAIIEKRANDEVENVQTQPNKRRKKKSIVWEHFTIEHVGAGCRRACCKQCKQSFAYSTGSKVAGTSHLKRHIAKGTCPVVLRNQEKNQLLTPNSAPSKINNSSAATSGNNIDTPKRRYRTAAAPYFAFDPDRCRLEIARMIIMHDYPLHIVEHPGFIAFVQNLQPRFDMVSFNTVQGDCVATYLREKQSIQRVIEGMPGRICLTLDLWTSCQTVGYVFLTGHFIDNDWKMHRKILNVVMEPYPDSDSSFSHAVAACLSDWSIEGRLFSITINQPLGETGVDNLRALLSVKNPLILGGQLLIGSCLARALSSIAQDALRAGYDTVKKVCDSVKYVKMSDSHEEKFLELKKHLQVPSTKTLALDDQSQWSSTYEMLLAASELKEVFSCLDTSDPDYKGAPSMEDWKLVETLCTYLKLLFDTASLLIATTVPTTNTFFHEAWKIQLELARAAASEDPIIRNLTHPMQENFDRYWKNSCLILAIAVVMDPRFKMKLVEFSFTKIYGEDAAAYIKTVDEGIHELFLEYVAHPLPLTPTYMEEVNGGFMRTEDSPGFLGSNGLGLTDFDVYIMETTSQQSKTELDQYLEESLLPRVHEFDVVGWWKLNKVKYPTLSKMARDILSIPVSTVGPESVFDTTSKEMDSYRCSLRPETVEAVICAKDWLNSELVESSNGLVKIEFPI